MRYASFAAALICFAVFLNVSVSAEEKAPEDIVRQLYDDFSKEGSGPVHMQKKDILSRYFSRALTGLLIKDQECRKKEQQPCAIDFMVQYDAEDEEITDFRIGSFDAKKNIVSVTFRNFEKAVAIDYLLKKTSSGWRISDIKYMKGLSLSEMLKAELED